jgi:carotenoid cleavage dioxygenase-like enzyme
MGSTSKRQQTMAKRTREQAVKEKRAQKAERRAAAKVAKIEGTIPEHLAGRNTGEHPLDGPPPQRPPVEAETPVPVESKIE